MLTKSKSDFGKDCGLSGEAEIPTQDGPVVRPLDVVRPDSQHDSLLALGSHPFQVEGQTRPAGDCMKRRLTIRPIETVRVKELSAAEEMKNALSSLARDIGEEGTDDENDYTHEHDFQDDGDETPHSWGTVDPFKGMSPSALGSFTELLHDLGFDMSLVELDSHSIRFKDTAMGFLWGFLAVADEAEGFEEE